MNSRLPQPHPTPVVILGATASGKSAVAAHVASGLRGEVLCCDAATVYRGLDIATAKPGPDLRALAVHHLLDACDPRELFSAARFAAAAEATLRDATARGVRIVLAGGSGLYGRALLQGLVPSPPVDATLRARLLAREARRPGSLHVLARRLDPQAAARHFPRDTLRLVRVIEHRLLTGRPLSEAQAEAPRGPRFQVHAFGLRIPRPVREQRIRLRVESMFAAGLLDEVAALLASGVPSDAPGFRAIGCREALGVLAGHHSVEDAKEMLVVATRQYAKRQDTWFRAESGVTWMDLAGDEAPAEVAASLVERIPAPG